MWVCVKTEKGLARRTNEDSYLIIDDKTKTDYDTVRRGTMFAVADGMGGQKGGAIASKMACKGLSDYYRRRMAADELLNPRMKLGLLEKIINAAHDKIQKYGERNKPYAHMGTTLSVLVLTDNLVLVAHVGDSRIYRMRSDNLEQLTEDHTMAQLSVEMGYLKLQDGTKHPLRHLLTQAVGEGMDEIQTRTEELEAGDRFLLCTDGLHGVVANDDIRKILTLNGVEDGVCNRLVETALANGGRDDMTAIVVQA
jgi:serine/threonine protein phosphatase PrpC